jgi:hypothetical protein
VLVLECPLPPADSKTDEFNDTAYRTALDRWPQVARTELSKIPHPLIDDMKEIRSDSEVPRITVICIISTSSSQVLDCAQLASNDEYNCCNQVGSSLLSATGVKGIS